MHKKFTSHFCDYKTIANTPNLPLFSPDKRFSFKERIFYYPSKRKALYGLYLRFPLDFFFRDCDRIECFNHTKNS